MLGSRLQIWSGGLRTPHGETMGGMSEIYFEFIIIQHLLGRTKAAAS